MKTAPDPVSAPIAPEHVAYDARDLMQSGTEVAIILDGTRYVLRITRAGKLILSK